MSLFTLSASLLCLLSALNPVSAQVTASGTQGPTNPPRATMGTAVNQTSMARLLSLNSINDWCVFGPPEPNSVIGDTEAFEVAWCMQPRNNARVIPDGTVTAAHFVKTPLYWQIQGFGDFTKLNILAGDEGGELDPHGATGEGNPVGGNVTTNATGSDVSYEEWMNYMSATQFCLRICISENSTYSASIECQHTIDTLGCQWVMPGDYTPNSFTECDGDSAYPPGVYPLANGSYSTFAQRYTGSYTQAGTVGLFTVGQTVTPSSAYSTPATSNCKTYTSIGNGIASLRNGAAIITGASGSSASGAMSTSSASMSGSMSSMSGSSRSGSASMSASAVASGVSGSAGSAVNAASGALGSATSRAGAMTGYAGNNYGTAMAAGFSVFAVMAGAGAILL